MSRVKYRRRGTAIVETNRGILLVAGNRGNYMLPGGGAERGESRFMAALRELSEETDLKPYYAEIIFKQLGKVNKSYGGGFFQDHHTVCVVNASGVPRAHDDAKRITYWVPGCRVRISTTTKEILERYYEWKKNKLAHSEQVVMDEEEEGNIDDVDDGVTGDYDSDQ
jgi:8-oxo-dGTP diphosphatase